MTKALRGVNLGGWLILEKWMTPSVFSGTVAVDEYTFIQTDGAVEKIKKHHDTFIQESDFAWLSENGIDAVRIPVGYWILDGAGPFVGCIDRLDWAFSMAEKYGLKVLIDLHGAFGSQNGQDHSGRIGRAEWYEDASHRDRTVKCAAQLAKRYEGHPHYWGLEVLNEPKYQLFWRILLSYYQQIENTLKEKRSAAFRVYPDGWQPRRMIRRLGDKAGVIDIHWYHFGFVFYKYVPLKLYYFFVHRRAGFLKRATRKHPIIIGEWSGVVAGEVLQKYPKDQRGSIEEQHFNLQIKTYESATAWFYWSYKTESAGMWNYRWLVENNKFARQTD